MRNESNKAFFPELISNYADYYAQGVQPRLTVAVPGGDIALVGVSGEFFSSHSIRLKERARMKELLFFGYCNGYDQYFPTIETVAESGYSTENTSAPAAVGAGDSFGLDLRNARRHCACIAVVRRKSVDKSVARRKRPTLLKFLLPL